MSKPVVLIADKLAPSTVEALGEEVEVRWVDGPNRDELLGAVGEADALLVRSATTVDEEVLEAANNLKIVGRAGVGLDNVDVPAATARGVMVVNAPTSNIDRKSTRLNSSHVAISYAVFCLKKKTTITYKKSLILT